MNPRKIAIATLSIIGVFIILMFIFRGCESDPVESKQKQIDSLTIELAHLQSEISYKGKENEILSSQIKLLTDTIYKVRKEKKAIQNQIALYKRKVFTEDQLDSAFKKRYASFAKKDSLMNLPIQTGRDVVNDLNEYDYTKQLVTVQESEINLMGGQIEKQNSIIQNDAKKDSVQNVQVKAFQEQVLALNQEANTWKDKSQKQDNKIRNVKAQRNAGFAIIVLEALRLVFTK